MSLLHLVKTFPRSSAYAAFLVALFIVIEALTPGVR